MTTEKAQKYNELVNQIIIAAETQGFMFKRKYKLHDNTVILAPDKITLLKELAVDLNVAKNLIDTMQKNITKKNIKKGKNGK